MPVKQPRPSALAQAVPPPMVLSIGRSPADAAKLAQTSRNAIHPTTVLSDFNHLINYLSPPSHVAMGGKQHQAGVEMMPSPRRLGMMMKQMLKDAIGGRPLERTAHGRELMAAGLLQRHVPGYARLLEGTKNSANEQLYKAASDARTARRLNEGAVNARNAQAYNADDLLRSRIAQQMPWMTEPSLNLRQWMMEAVNNKGGSPHPLLQPTVKGGTDTQKALLDFFIQSMKNKPSPKKTK